MNRRWAILSTFGTLAVATPTGAATNAATESERLFKGVATLSVDELGKALKEEGYQHRFLAHQINFECTCRPYKGPLDKDVVQYVEIDGLTLLSKARLFNLWPNVESQLSNGARLAVHGLILEQNYGVWSIWVYHARHA